MADMSYCYGRHVWSIDFRLTLRIDGRAVPRGNLYDVCLQWQFMNDKNKRLSRQNYVKHLISIEEE